MLCSLPAVAIQQALWAVCAEIREEQETTAWWTLEERALWRELVAGILGSRASYEVTVRAVDALDTFGLLNPGEQPSGLYEYQAEVEAVLTEGIEGGRYPYPRQRAERIRRSAEAIYAVGTTLHDLLSSSSSANSLRRNLIEKAVGIGPKQASMFLRNIGYPCCFAVLDSHVLSYMRLFDLLPRAAAAVSSLAQYETVEARFLAHARDLGVAPRRLDLAVWVVMRSTAKGGK